MVEHQAGPLNQVEEPYLMQCIHHMSEELCRKLKAARENLGLSQSQAAQAWGVPLRTLISWENDQRTPRGLALQAIEEKLEKALKQPNPTTMKIIDRLKKTVKDTANQDYTQGFDSAKEWASETATARELKNLESGIEAHRPYENVLFQNERSLASEIEGKPFNSTYDSDDFWNNVFGDEIPEMSPDFLRGFAEGALSIWKEVKHQL